MCLFDIETFRETGTLEIESLPDKQYLHMSESFEVLVKDGDYEWMAVMYNINEDITRNCWMDFSGNIRRQKMKVLFLHLSDAHLKQDTNLNEINTKALVSSLSQMGEFDECVVVFSGDIVNSGNANEYKVAGRMFGRILKGINDKYFGGKKHIQTLIVPGNHDNMSKNKARKREEIIDFYTDKKTESHYYDDLKELDNFFSFCGRSNCFKYCKNDKTNVYLQ